jgi:hypothetical protein
MGKRKALISYSYCTPFALSVNLITSLTKEDALKWMHESDPCFTLYLSQKKFPHSIDFHPSPPPQENRYNLIANHQLDSQTEQL